MLSLHYSLVLWNRAISTSSFFFKFSGQQWLQRMTHKNLRSIIRTPWMRACSFQKGVRADWQLLELWGLYLCLQLFPVPPRSQQRQVSVCVGVCVCVCVCVHVSVPVVHQCMHPWNLPRAWIPGCHGVTSHLHWLPEGAAVRQAIFAEGTQVAATPVINDIALSGTPVWAHCGALEGL